MTESGKVVYNSSFFPEVFFSILSEKSPSFFCFASLPPFLIFCFFSSLPCLSNACFFHTRACTTKHTRTLVLGRMALTFSRATTRTTRTIDLPDTREFVLDDYDKENYDEIFFCYYYRKSSIQKRKDFKAKSVRASFAAL